MSLRERWSELDTAIKVIIGLGVAMFLFVALLVVVVILAAVVGTFALGVGSTEGVAETPQVQFEVEYGTVDGDPAARITHDGGEAVVADDLEIHVDDRIEDWPDSDGEVTAGDEVIVRVSPAGTIRVVWIGSDDPGTVLFESEVPPEAEF